MRTVKLVFYLKHDVPIYVDIDVEDTEDLKLDYEFFQKSVLPHGATIHYEQFTTLENQLVRVHEHSYYDSKGNARTVNRDRLIPSQGGYFNYSNSANKKYYEICMDWSARITVRHSVQDRAYNFISHDPAHSFEYFYEMLLQDNPNCIIVDPNFKSIDPLQLYENPAREYTWNLMQSQSCYSDIVIAQVSRYVNFASVDLQSSQVLNDYKTNLKQKIESERKRLREENEGEEAAVVAGNVMPPVEIRSKRFKQLLENSADRLASWNALVDITHNRLESIHKTFPAANKLSEAARRVIIDQFIISVCDFMQTTWQVEYPVNKADENQIGWGKLDYKFGEEVVAVTKAIVEDPCELTMMQEKENEEEEETNAVKGPAIPTANLPVNSSSSSSRFDATSPRQLNELHVLEAKDKNRLNDQACAQVAAQQHDLSVCEGKEMVRGILSTGTTWDFFQLTTREGAKPDMTYEGGKILHIVKDATVSSKRRPSALTSSSVSKKEVEDVMLALASSMQA